MRLRPILFSGQMVRAILEGRKTQTRRIVKFPHPGIWERGQLPDSWVDLANPVGTYPTYLKCPYGQPGDVLWVRESWAFWGGDEYLYQRISANVMYRASWTDDTRRPIGWCSDGPYGDRKGWRPSIHMPRWASRISLEVVSVRVERVQDISEADAIAESFKDREDFFRTFYDLNKRAPREESPWVWVVSFERTEKPGGAA